MNSLLKPRLFLLLPLVASGALGSTIGTLHNTGLATPANIDPYWTVNGQSAYVTDTSGFPFSPWVSDTDSSKWISPLPSYTNWQSDAPGQYVYATTFDLTGFDPATAYIEFSWAVDNAIGDVMLNGVSIGHAFDTSSDFAFQAPVTLSSGFERGLNLLEFQTVNFAGSTGNPNGLRVEFTSNADPSTAPEPVTMLLIGAGLLGLLVAARRENARR
jgi:PEP-CTERM motif